MLHMASTGGAELKLFITIMFRLKALQLLDVYETDAEWRQRWQRWRVAVIQA